MTPEQQNEQTLWGFLRGQGHKTQPDYDYDQYLNDVTSVRLGCALFVFMFVIAVVVGLSLVGAR